MSAEKFRIVAVDDDKDILQLINMTLGDDYQVITISDPGRALDALDYLEPDAVLVDIMMPKVTGYQIIETIRKNPKLTGTQIIVISAKDSHLDVKYGYKIGANFYLTKPFQPERVRRTLEMLFQQAGSKPRPKTLSTRDIELRLQSALSVPAANAQGTPVPETGGGFRMRRMLGQEAHDLHQQRAHGESEDEDDPGNEGRRKTWVG